MNNENFTLEQDNEYAYATNIVDAMLRILRDGLCKKEHKKYVDILEKATMKQKLIYGTYTYQQGVRDSMLDIQRQVMGRDVDDF